MPNTTPIPWTDVTWNPTRGCSAAAPGCHYCYATRYAHRFSGPGQPYEGLVTSTPPSHPRWTGNVQLLPTRLLQPLHWRKPRRIFICSLSDLFHQGVPDTFIRDVCRTITLTPHHTYQLLTKRPERAQALFRNQQWLDGLELDADISTHARLVWPLPNLWLGASASTQHDLNHIIPPLLNAPATIRFISFEPLLGPVDTDTRPCPHGCADQAPDRSGPDRGKPPYCGVDGCDMETPGRIPFTLERIHWVIAGGESGGTANRALVKPCPRLRWDTHARGRDPSITCDHCHDTRWIPKTEALAWVSSLRDQCTTAGIPFFFKGWGGPTQRAAGDLLDGQQYHELPTQVSRRYETVTDV